MTTAPAEAYDWRGAFVRVDGVAPVVFNEVRSPRAVGAERGLAALLREADREMVGCQMVAVDGRTCRFLGSGTRGAVFERADGVSLYVHAARASKDASLTEVLRAAIEAASLPDTVARLLAASAPPRPSSAAAVAEMRRGREDAARTRAAQAAWCAGMAFGGVAAAVLWLLNSVTTGPSDLIP